MGSPNLQVVSSFSSPWEQGQRTQMKSQSCWFSCIDACDNFSFDRRPRTEWSAKGSGLQADKSLRGKQARDLKDHISSSCQDTHSEPNRFQNIFFSQPKEGNPNMTWGYLHGQVNQTRFPLIYLYVGLDWILKHQNAGLFLVPLPVRTCSFKFQRRHKRIPDNGRLFKGYLSKEHLL